MSWKLMEDPANIENRNAGNGGDLVKHTVYLATLRFLLTHEPWRNGLLLRECHAGRGIYRIPNGDPRRILLSCLYSDPATKDPILLQGAQRSILGALGCWPDTGMNFQWYAGSALINSSALADNQSGLHGLDLYEWQPETRRILRAVLTDAPLRPQPSCSVLPEEEHGEVFDGEAYIEQRIGRWQKKDVVLLDPFAMWRQPTDQFKRNRYGAIVDGLLRHGTDAPSLVLFWTWGRAFPVADGELNGTIAPVKNGYQELRAKLHKAGVHFVLVTWRWGLQFAMWVVVPGEHVNALRDDIDIHCRLLSRHLVQHSCGRHLSHSTVNVAID